MADLVLIVSCLLGVGFLATRLASLLRLPHSVLLVLLGILGGLILRSLGYVPSPDLWSHFPELVLYILLPPLVFDSAYQIEWHALRRDRWPLLVLSVPALLASCFLIGAGLHYALGIDWRSALLFGALISATDPVAVVALFRELGARQRLTLLVEGESLLNDGTAIVLFRVLLAGAAFDLTRSVFDFLLISVGGVLVGTVLVQVFRLFFAFTAESSGPAQVGLSATAAYVSFIVADHILGVSGVLSTMTVGLYLGAQSRLTLNRDALHSMHGVWDFFALSANTMIFLAVGLSFDQKALLEAAPFLPPTLLTVYLTRALTVFGSLAVVNRTGLCDPIGRRQQLVIAWGGLRGGLALALALILPDTFAHKALFLSLATAVVLATLICNGLTTGWLLHKLELNSLTANEKVLLSRSLRLAFERAFLVLDRSARHGGLSEQLLEDVKARACGTGAQLPEEQDRAAFEARQSLATEQARYDRQLELGVLSTRSYLRLSRSVEERLRLLESETVEALRSYRFDLDDLFVESYRYGASELPSLELKLEMLLHLCLGLEQANDLSRVWQESAAHLLDQFQRSHPELGMAVQSAYVARVLAAAAERELADLRDSRIINPTIFAQAMSEVATLHDELLADSARLRRPHFRELLERVRVFSGLPEGVLAQIQSSARRRPLKPGEPVFAEGDPGSSFFVVLRGLLEARQSGDEEPRRLFAGSAFGELSLVFHVPRTASVTAVLDTELLEVEQELFHQLMELSPEFKGNVRELAVRRAARVGLPIPPELA